MMMMIIMMISNTNRNIMRDSLRIALIALFILPQTSSIKKCPIECTCDLDISGRYSALCERGMYAVRKDLINFNRFLWKSSSEK